MAPLRTKPFAWTNGDQLLTEPLGTSLCEIKKTIILIQENASENIVCIIAAIF